MNKMSSNKTELIHIRIEPNVKEQSKYISKNKELLHPMQCLCFLIK